MKAKQVYIKVQENEENIDCLHEHIKQLQDKIDLLCDFIQQKHELKEEHFLKKINLKDLKKEVKCIEKPVLRVKEPKKGKKVAQRQQGKLKAVVQKGKMKKNGQREQVRIAVKPRRQGAPVQLKKRARRFRKA